MTSSRCAFYFPLPSVRAFGGSLHLLCPLLTSALRSDHLATASVPPSGHSTDLPRQGRPPSPHARRIYHPGPCWPWTSRSFARSAARGGLIIRFLAPGPRLS